MTWRGRANPPAGLASPADRPPRFSVAGRLALGIVVLAVAASAPAVVAPLDAVAGSYHVYSCALPNGRPAPTEGWSGSISGPFMNPIDSCAEGGSLQAVIDGSPAQPVNAIVTWEFSTPAFATIKAAKLWRADSADSLAEGSNQSLAWMAAPNNSYDSADVFDQCLTQGCGSEGEPSSRFAAANLVTIPSSYLDGASHIYMNASCGGAQGGSCPAVGSTYMASAQLLAADITLEANSPPSASAVGGSLLTNQILNGPQNLLVTASDPGPGVYQAIFEIDGKAVASSVLNSNGGRCENVGGTSDGTAAFLYLQPCPSQVNSVDVPFDPSVAPEGPQELTVLISDAAGNTTTILDHQVIVDNSGAYTTLLRRGACNGISCDDHAQLMQTSKQRASFTRHLSNSGLTLTGRLLDHTGAPIKGAELQLLYQPTEAGAAIRTLASVSTDENGAWAFKVPDGPSRLLRVAYYSHTKDTTPAAQLDYHERVYAAVLLHAPRHARPGAAVIFRGRLLGGFIPYRGGQVQIEILYDGRWRTIEVLSTDKHGRFAYSYIFNIGGGSSYRFRARVRYSPAYPFLAAASRPVKVKVE
jgi:hypothetical protein